jgi:hypothetical protein
MFYRFSSKENASQTARIKRSPACESEMPS